MKILEKTTIFKFKHTCICKCNPIEFKQSLFMERWMSTRLQKCGCQIKMLIHSIDGCLLFPCKSFLKSRLLFAQLPEASIYTVPWLSLFLIYEFPWEFKKVFDHLKDVMSRQAWRCYVVQVLPSCVSLSILLVKDMYTSSSSSNCLFNSSHVTSQYNVAY